MTLPAGLEGAQDMGDAIGKADRLIRSIQSYTRTQKRGCWNSNGYTKLHTIAEKIIGCVNGKEISERQVAGRPTLKSLVDNLKNKNTWVQYA